MGSCPPMLGKGRRAFMSTVHTETIAHPFAVSCEELQSVLTEFLGSEPQLSSVKLKVPSQGGVVLPSARLAHAAGI